MNESRQLIQSLRPMMEGTSTEVFFDPTKAQLLANVLASPVTVAERHRVGQILSDDQIADTIMSWPADEDIRPVVLDRLEGWLNEGPGPWREPWDDAAREIIEDLAMVAKAVTAMMKQFKIRKKVDWNKLLKGGDKAFDKAMTQMVELVSKDFRINDKGARDFITKMVDLKLSVGAIGA